MKGMKTYKLFNHVDNEYLRYEDGEEFETDDFKTALETKNEIMKEHFAFPFSGGINVLSIHGFDDGIFIGEMMNWIMN